MLAGAARSQAVAEEGETKGEEGGGARVGGGARETAGPLSVAESVKALLQVDSSAVYYLLKLVFEVVGRYCYAMLV